MLKQSEVNYNSCILRFDQYGKELLKFKDRSERDFVLGPTHEEIICEIFRSYPISYKELPINLYQIQTKFRDDTRKCRPDFV